MKICHYNINSVLKYKQELLTTFPEVDIFSLNETRLPTPTAHLSFPGYTIYRQDRQDKAGHCKKKGCNKNPYRSKNHSNTPESFMKVARMFFPF
jgi:exonuclease III